LRQEHPKIKTATPANLERISREKLLNLSGYDIDSALVLRTRQEPNSYLANDFFEQFKSKGINLKEDSAYVILLNYLSLRKDLNSPHKLSFVLPNSLEVLNKAYFEAPILNSVSQQKFNSSDVDIKTGIPIILSGKGERTLYTRNWENYEIKNSGLVGVYLNRDSSLFAWDVDRVDFNGNGLVVFVRY
jgi:hypothetical protein